MQILGRLGTLLKKVFNSMECFRFVLFVTLFFGVQMVSNIAVGVVLLWSVYLFVRKLLVQGGIRHIRYRHILYIFLGFALLTTIIHWHDNLLDNLVMIYMMFVYLFQIYGLYAEKSNLQCRRELKFTLKFLFITTTVLMIVGLTGLAVFPKGLVWNNLHFILYESRFLGVLFNANAAGFYGAMAIIACHIVWRTERAENNLSVRKRLLYIGCIVINAIALFLSDSNAALLFLVIYCSFAIFYIMFRDFGKKRMRWLILRITATVLSFIVIITSSVFFRVFTQSRVSLAITSGQSQSELSKGVITQDGIVKLKDDEYRENIFGHENKNIDSGRFKVWTQSLELLEKFPLLGIGRANIIDYGAKYIGGMKYTDFHNGFITLLVSYGIVGFNLLIVFILTIAKDILKTIFHYKKKCREDGSVLILITGFCLAYMVYSMFEPTLLADCSYRVYIFWLMVGFAMSYVQKYRRQMALNAHDTDQSVTDLPSAVENIRKKRRLKKVSD